MQPYRAQISIDRVAICLENPEIAGILTAVRDFIKSQGSVGKQFCQGKVAKNCLLLVAYLDLYGYLVASS